MPPIVHPGRLLKRELQARKLSANRMVLSLLSPWFCRSQYDIAVVERERGEEIAKQVRSRDAA